jgi:hypothetical protein
MVKGFWASSSGAPAFLSQKERAGSATRHELTIRLHKSFNFFLDLGKFFSRDRWGAGLIPEDLQPADPCCENIEGFARANRPAD